MLKSIVVAIGASAFLGVLGIIEAKAADGPLHGRSRYENINGQE
jgi:hypothetical protein